MKYQESKKYIMTNQGAIVIGIVWAFFMILFTQFLFPWFMGNEITKHKLYFAVPIWIVAGLIYGFLMKHSATKKEKRKK